VERRAKKLKLAEQELKLPPIRGIAWCEVRERDWANVVTCHVGEPRAYTWRLSNGVLGEHVLVPPSKVGRDGVSDKGKPVCSVAVSACGNFAVIGTEGGDVHRFNLQSGQHRGAFKRTAAEEGKTAETTSAPTGPRRQLNLRGGARSIWNMADKSYGMSGSGNARTAPAHVGAVAAIATDGSNKQVITGGSADGMVRVWNFAAQHLEGEMDTGCGVQLMSLHKPGALVAAAGVDMVVRVLDVAGMRRVRSLKVRHLHHPLCILSSTARVTIHVRIYVRIHVSVHVFTTHAFVRVYSRAYTRVHSRVYNRASIRASSRVLSLLSPNANNNTA